MSTLAEMQDVVRFSERLLPFLNEDMSRVELMLTAICDNFDMSAALLATETDVYVVRTDIGIKQAIGLLPTEIFVHRYQSEDGGTVKLFNNNSHPTWTNADYVSTFRYGGINYNGFRFNTSDF